MRIETPLLVVGRSPAAVVVAKVAAWAGLPCLLAGHEVSSDDAPVPLDAAAVEQLERHGLVDVLRPYFTSADPLTIGGRTFEDVIKHHCVADLNVVVYDEVTVIERVAVGRGVRGVLTDGASRWELSADLFVDADLLASALSHAITSGAAVAMAAVEAHAHHVRAHPA
ncbi:MAG: hypothetical protein JWM12_1821 [Ilumatobacteraceae bacterium]|nr:hypothetical protein [Ilumatobacteraceae bacterium]